MSFKFTCCSVKMVSCTVLHKNAYMLQHINTTFWCKQGTANFDNKNEYFFSIRIAAIHSYWSHVAKDRLLAHMKKILSDTALMYHKSLTDCSIIRKDCVRGAED